MSLQSFWMDRLPFRTRARVRIFRDTFAFFKGRIVPFIIGVIGIIVAYLYGPIHATSGFLVRSVVILLCTYGIAFVGALIVSTLRVPWLLDAESGKQIDDLEERVPIEGAGAEDKHKQQKNSENFAALMHEGKELADELLQMPHFGRWLEKRRNWIDRVSQAFKDQGWPTEAAAFIHAGEASPNIGGIVNSAYRQRFYGEQLESCRAKLGEIVQRRLP